MTSTTPNAAADGPPPAISVILCTRNPHPGLLRRTFDALHAQTLSRTGFELILVDNGSSPPLDPSSCSPEPASVRVVREPAPGLTAARCAGIAQARADLLAFVDDDNFLDPDYLEQAVRIAADNPAIGHFGGIARAELEVPPSRAKTKLLGYLGIRDHGPEPITSGKPQWGPWEPIGAGMVCRRDVALRWVAMVNATPEAKLLGRAGASLLAGEDTLFARAANSLGYACSYQPALRLTHYIKKNRLSWRYLCRLMEGHGRSFVLLRRAAGENPRPIARRAELVNRLRHRLRHHGPVLGFVHWFWDLGYRAQAAVPMSPRTHSQPEHTLPLPKISIVVPNYNSGATLERTIRSLLAQEYPNLQIIMMDSMSKDNSIEIIERYRQHFSPCVIEKDKGQADGLNKGFSHATGDIYAWLCSDDELTPGALHHVADLFRRNPDADLVIGHCQRIFSDGNTCLVTPDQASWDNINVQNGLDQPSLFWRASLHARAGALDTTYNLAFDWDFWNRFKRRGARPVFTDRVLSRYYFSDTNKSGNSGSQHVREAFRILRKYGPLRGNLAHVFRFLYKHFDLKGCYDKPPTCTLLRSHLFVWTLAALAPLIGRRRLYQYNWHFASCQERGLKWW